MTALEKENSELKANLNKQKEEMSKLTKINDKLRKNLEQLSSKVDILLKKANDNAENKKKKKINNTTQNSVNVTKSNNEKNNINNEMDSKEKQLKNSLSMIHYLTKDNQKLKKQIEALNQISPVDTHSLEVIKKKDDEINMLNVENRKLKDEVNKFKYAEKTIETLKKRITNLQDTLNRVNGKMFSLKEENNSIKNNNIDLNSDNNSKNNFSSIIQKSKIKKSNILNNSNNNLNKNLGRQRSSSLSNINKNKDIKPFSTSKNFYRLFNESEQKAISTLFSEEDLHKFKEKVGILENRNSVAEKLYEKEIKNLKKSVAEKDEEISYCNKKMHEKDQQITVLNNQIKELKEIKKNIKKNNEKQEEKGLNVEEQLKEFGYGKIMKNKDEQIEKLNSIINTLKEQINKEHIERNKEKEIYGIKKELGVIEIVDLKNILPDNTTKFIETKLKIKKKEAQVYIQGKKKVVNSNENVNKLNNKNEYNKSYSIYSGGKNINSQNKKNNFNKVGSLSSQKGKKK